MSCLLANSSTIPEMHIYQGFYNMSPFQQLLSASTATLRKSGDSTPHRDRLTAYYTGLTMQPHRPLQDAGKWPFSGPLITPHRQQLEISASSHSLGNFLSSLSRRELGTRHGPTSGAIAVFSLRPLCRSRQRILASDIVDPNVRPWSFESVRRERIFAFDPHSLFDSSFARTIILGYRRGSSTADRRRDWPSKPGFWPSNDVDIV